MNAGTPSLNARANFHDAFAAARRAQRKAAKQRERMMGRLYGSKGFGAVIDALHWQDVDPLELRAGKRPVVIGDRVEWRHVSRISGKELKNFVRP